MLKKVSNYLSLVKFAHTIFALPFALVGFFLAIHPKYFPDSPVHTNYYHLPTPYLLLLVILCMVFARNTAMSFNRYADRSIDSLNPRTLMREIPSSIIKPRSALFFSISNGIFFIAATFFINKLCFMLSPVALFVITGYSFTKRFTSLSHVILGLGLSLAPIGAYIAVTGEFKLLPVIFSLIVLFWVAGFDVIYALQDTEFDNSQKLKSIPARMGKKNAIIVSILFHILSVVLVLIAGYISGAGILFWIGAIIFIILLAYQHFLIKPDDLSKVNVAFFTLNGIASIVFAVAVISDLYL